MIFFWAIGLPIKKKKISYLCFPSSPLFFLFRFVATLVRDVPFCFIFFPLYAYFKSVQVKLFQPTSSNQKEKEPFFLGLTSGLLAGGISGALVTPADMLKTRIQDGRAGNEAFLKYGQRVVRAEGFSALYRGWHTRVMIIAPLYGLISLAFELQKNWLEERDKKA